MRNSISFRSRRRILHVLVLAVVVLVLVSNVVPAQVVFATTIATADDHADGKNDGNKRDDGGGDNSVLMNNDDADEDADETCQAASATPPPSRSTTTSTDSSSSNDEVNDVVDTDTESNNGNNDNIYYDDPLLRNALSKIHVDKFYINGSWVEPLEPKYTIDVIDPSIGKSITKVSMGNEHDVNVAVQAAKDAFPKWAYETTPQQRLEYVQRILEIYETKYDEMSILISREMGAPISMAYTSQVDSGYYNIETFIELFPKFKFIRNLPQYYEQSKDPYNGRNRHHQRNHYTTIMMDPVGVVGMITPWNWPLNQITLKVIPALLVGCTCILKPSELSPLSALLFASIVDEAQLPSGVFNLINGQGTNSVGQYLSNHPQVDMISFTGSTRAGALVSKAAANTFKKVTLELGGKGACIIFEDTVILGDDHDDHDEDGQDDDDDDENGSQDDDDDDADEANDTLSSSYDYEWFDEIVTNTVYSMFYNSGQSCNAPSRMLIQDSGDTLLLYERAIQIAKTIAESIIVDSAHVEGEDNHIGPVVSKQQYDKIQDYIQYGIEVDGATLIAGGLGKPQPIQHSILERRQQEQQRQRRSTSTTTSNTTTTTTTTTADDEANDIGDDSIKIGNDDDDDGGYYVRPTVFGNCTSTMKVFQEEIFGPVLCISRFHTVDNAIQLANDTPYGLTNYVYSSNSSKRQYVSKRLRCGMVEMNDSPSDIGTPFGGTRNSGVGGREGGLYGLDEYCEIKSITGYHYEQDTDIGISNNDEG